MSDAPERINIIYTESRIHLVSPARGMFDGVDTYTLTDIHDAVVAERDALKAALLEVREPSND
tara:strand:+ start:191 stop:379 length:189 start_codon:yes stop_codon:yes gene_type:complete